MKKKLILPAFYWSIYLVLSDQHLTFQMTAAIAGEAKGSMCPIAHSFNYIVYNMYTDKVV